MFIFGVQYIGMYIYDLSVVILKILGIKNQNNIFKIISSKFSQNYFTSIIFVLNLNKLFSTRNKTFQTNYKWS